MLVSAYGMLYNVSRTSINKVYIVI